MASLSQTFDTTRAESKSGVGSGREVETWADGITLKDEVCYLTQFVNYPERLPLWARDLSFVMIPQFRNFARILHMTIGKS